MMRNAFLALAALALNVSATQVDVDVDVDINALPISSTFDLASTHSFPTGPVEDQYEPQSNTNALSAAYESWRQRSMTDVVESTQTNDASSDESHETHSMHTMQASSDMFGMYRLTAAAPWSTRIQPGLQFRQNSITYTQHATGIRIRAGSTRSSLLHMFEGGFTQSYNGTNMIENDVWLSADDGMTWDLIAGRSLFGASGSVYASNRNSFSGRKGSSNCADPVSDIVLSLGGANPVSGNNTNEAWYSNNGVDWGRRTSSFSPARHFTSCDIDEMGVAFVIGGHARDPVTNKDYLLDDIWMTNALYAYNPWRRVTDHAPFGPREEHLVLVANSTALKSEIIYVISGKVTCNLDSENCYDGTNSNDVWASSDSAKSWVKLPTPQWGPRWGAGGVVTRDGVLLVWGGLNSDTSKYADTYTQRDLYASFNGGSTWHQCSVNSTAWIRGESSAVINARGRLIVSSGYAYSGIQQVRYNDVWMSSFSVEDTRELAKRCGGDSVIPAAGAGMRVWPGSTPQTNIISFTPVTRRAPWSPRIQPALFLQSHPRTYINPNDGSTASTGQDWLLMYEGSLTAGILNENDVYASADNGESWVLISGIAQRGLHGYQESASPSTSFDARGAAGNCENPTNDDVYSLGGIRYYRNGSSEAVTDVWYSSDAINWVSRPTTGKRFSPGRYFSSCDIDNKGTIYLIGGQTVDGTYLNDVWSSKDRGISWNLVVKAKFPVRSEHAVQIVHSERYQTDIIYVIGGYTKLSSGAISVLNDVWVSSNAKDWKSILSVSRTSFSPRWGHGAVVTDAGLLLVMGGTDGQGSSPEDLWASLDGGKNWFSCRLPTNGGIIRGEQGLVLTHDEKLLIGNGYSYQVNPSYRTEFSDLWISDMSFKDPKSAALRSACPGLTVPSKIGYVDQSWEPVDPDGPDDDDSSTGLFSSTGSSGSSSASGLSTTVVIGIVVAVIVVLGVAFYSYRHHAKTGSWNIFSSEPARAAPVNIDTTSLFADSDSSATTIQHSQSATQMSHF